MTTYIADIDLVGSEMERPFMRVYVEGDDEQAALAAAERAIEAGEKVRGVRPLQPILDGYAAKIAEGHRVAISWKHEGSEGPVWLTDLDDPTAPTPGVASFRPFGADDEAYVTSLPWMRRAEAKRLAKYLGLPLEES